MKRSYLFTAYIVEFQVLNGMRIGELLAIQPDNIDFENKKLVIDGTIHWRKDGNKVGFKDTTKTSSYRTISLTTRSCDILRRVMLENKKAFNGKLCMWIGALYSQVIEATLYLLHQLIGTYK